jgi:hypothetical protein
MSGFMKITFAPGMPPAAVEILSPDLQTVDTLSLRAGDRRAVQVPSEASFLRVHLPSGKIVTVQHPGDLDYNLSLPELLGKEERALLSAPEREESEMKKITEIRPLSSRNTEDLKPIIARARFQIMEKGAEMKMERGVAVEVGQPMLGRLVADGSRLTLRPPDDRSLNPVVGHLNVSAHGGTLRLQLPGNLRLARVEVENEQVSINLATKSPLADSISAYLLRGNYDAAKSMAQLLDGAYFALAEKMQDPVTAVIGAYLLLRLERFDLLHDWARNLANWFPDMSDGAIIWACQLLEQGKEWHEAARYLQIAAERELPIYTEGLRMLVDATDRLEGPESKASRRLTERVGQVNWNSPFTAGVIIPPMSRDKRPVFRIGFLNLP